MAKKILLGAYLKRLAAKTPTPGGGSAAALTAALGAALLSMSAKYILKRTKTKSVRSKISAISSLNEKAVARLERLMGEDEKAYHRLVSQITRPRPRNILRLYKNAAEVPLEVCGIAASLSPGCVQLCRYANTSIVSDVAEAAYLLEAAFLAARLNVEINLCSINTADYKNKIIKVLRNDERKIIKSKSSTLAIARKSLK